MLSRHSLSLRRLKHWPLRITPERLLFDKALALACDLNHLAYDCFHLLLADLMGTALVTADRKFANKVATPARVVFMTDFLKA